MKKQRTCATCRWKGLGNSPMGDQCQNPEEIENATHDERPITLVFDDDPACRYYAPSDAEAYRLKRNARQRSARSGMREAMESCGLVKVRGNLGGTYWE